MKKGRPLLKSQYMRGGWWLYCWPRFLWNKYFVSPYWKREIKKGHWKYKTQYLNDPKGGLN